MNGFMIGDTVECIETISPDVNGPIKGRRYKVISINQDSLGLYIPDCTYDDATRLGKRPNWGVGCFKLSIRFKDIPFTEIEYLDRFQFNFKEGV